MLRLVLYRLLAAIPTLVVSTIVIFFTINLIPGTAATAALGLNPTPAGKAAFEQFHGLDRPLPIQYVDWLASALQGDLGNSFQNGVPIAPDLLARLPVTLELTLLAGLIAFAIALPLGVIAAYQHERRADTAISIVGVVAVSIPDFWLATVLVLVLSMILQIVPPGGYVPIWTDPVRNLTLMVLPALSLGLVASALLLRMMRTAMLEVLSSDFIRTATAKGASGKVVVVRHALRNALIPFLTVGALQLSALFGGAVIVETIFLLPGVGSLVLIAIRQRDYPVLQAAVLVITAFVLVGNLVVDVLSAYIDPRQVRRAAG